MSAGGVGGLGANRVGGGEGRKGVSAPPGLRPEATD